MAKSKLGSGARFKALKKKLAGRKGVYDPAGLSEWIGARKYGSAKMHAMAAAGRRRKS